MLSQRTRLIRFASLALSGLLLTVFGSRPLAVSAAEANLPPVRVQSIFPAGGQRGTSFDFEISGRFFEGLTGLHFSAPGITAELVAEKPAEPAAEAETAGPDGPGGRQPRQQRFRVTIAPEVKPGICEVRAVGTHGASTPHAFIVGAQRETVEVEPNNQAAQATETTVDSVVEGRMDSPTDVDFFRFNARAGQRLILDCAAYWIDSPLDAVLVLYDGAGEEIDRSHDDFRRDPLIDFTVPADGQYLVSVHDLVYAGSKRHIYHLSISTAPHIDFVIPPAGLPGSQERDRVFGRNLPGGQPVAGLAIDRRPLEVLEMSIPLPADPAAQQIAGSQLGPVEAGIDGVEFELDSPVGPSNSARIGLAAPVIVEQEPNDDAAHAQKVALPCEYVGQFYPRSDRDWIAFDARQGEVYWIEVFAERLGLSADPTLVIQRVAKDNAGAEVVTELQAVDDDSANAGGDMFPTNSDDPAFAFTVPADGTYRVMVTDLAGSERSDPRFIYRMSIRQAQPDFRLVAVPSVAPNDADPKKVGITIHNDNLRRGGTDLIEIAALRRHGFDGEIVVNAGGLPAGVTAPTITIGPGQNSATLVLSAAEDAPDSQAPISITGTAHIGSIDVVRAARPATMVSAGVPNQINPRSRLARDLVVGVLGTALAPYSLDVGSTPALETSRAGSVTIPVNIVRRGDFKGPVSLVALSLPPGAAIKEAVTVAADQTTGTVELKLGKTTPLGTYSFYIDGIADLPPNPERRRPEPVKVGTASLPMKLTVTGATIRLAVTAPTEAVRQGTKVELPIKIERLYNYADPVQVRIVIPGGVEGITAATATIPRGKSDATLAVTLGPAATLGVLKLTVNAMARLSGLELPATQEIELKVEPPAQ